MPAPKINPIDHPAILQIVFHPRPDESAPDPQHDIRLPVGDGVTLGGRLHPAADVRAPLVLFFHGNGEIAADYDDIAPMYNRLGLSFLVVDYRGYGRSGGTPTLSNLVSDARMVWDALPNLLVDRGMQPSRTYVMGRSLGSASALEIGVHAGPAIAGLILESGFAYEMELITRLGGPAFAMPDDGRQGLGHLTKIEAIRRPTLILHGEDDWIIPVKDARALHHHSGAATKRLVTVPGAGHNDLLYVGAREYFSAIRDFTSTGNP
ncbi:MAG: lysophospholipase [Lentisphaerae bacterium]|nr:lysophospholipase [Lentisphaerota bacterium]